MRSWTDGSTNIGYDNVFAPLMLCPLCQKSFWKSDARELGDLPLQPRPMGRLEVWYAKLSGDKERKLAAREAWNNFPNALRDAPHTDIPDFSDWLELLQDSAKLRPEREVIARRKVWRTSSDHVRLRIDGIPCSPMPVLTENEATENRLALLALHENSSASNVTEKAELLRQLGRFDEAMQVLESASEEEQKTPLAIKIMTLAKSGDVVVREV
jgi:alkanesulfonate monooxygenase SsuD/methylene tetrahydromethanopterin reductase-like flavin-dependent oxidoreductase (luciferase family)